MQTVSWLGFGICSSLTRTMVHFFPSAGGVSAPYQSSCQISVFSSAMEPKSALLDGVRLSQPDGIRLEEAFPALQPGGGGLFGVHIKIATNQPRVELQKSLCFIEVVNQFNSARFAPYLERAASAEPASPRGGAAIKDAFHTTTCVIVNGSDKNETVSLLASGIGNEPVRTAATREVPSGGVIEVDLDAAQLFTQAQPVEQSWGLVRSQSVFLNDNLSDQIGVFLVYRDCESKKPISVCAL